jgi:hypothetical protein
MALSPQIVTYVDSSNQKLTVVDITTYGGANPTRAQVGNVVLVYSATSKGDVVRQALPIDLDYQVDKKYEITISDAIYLKIAFIISDVWIAGSYAEGQIVLKDTTSEFYRALTATSNILSHADWELLDLTDSVDLRKFGEFNGVTFVDYMDGGDVLFASEIDVFSNIAKYEKDKSNIQADCNCNKGCKIDLYEKIRLLYEGILYHNVNSERQEMFEYLLALKRKMNGN